jgi:hypothetical protein
MTLSYSFAMYRHKIIVQLLDITHLNSNDSQVITGSWIENFTEAPTYVIYYEMMSLSNAGRTRILSETN